MGTTFQVISHAQVEGDFSFVNGTDLGNGTLLEKATLADQVRLLVRTPPELTVEDLTVTESDAGTVEAVVTVTLQETSNPVRVNFATQADSANPIEDFLDSNGQLESAANETSKTLTVPIVGDLRDEDPQTGGRRRSTHGPILRLEGIRSASRRRLRHLNCPLKLTTRFSVRNRTVSTVGFHFCQCT